MMKANLNMNSTYYYFGEGGKIYKSILYLKTLDFYIPVAVLNYQTQWRSQIFTHIILYFFLRNVRE